MPTDVDHLSQSNRNIDFLKSFYSTYKFNDWAVTVSFYITVHAVEFLIFKLKSITYNGKQLTVEHSNQFFQVLSKNNLLPANYSVNSSEHLARKIIVSQNFGPVAQVYNSFYNNSRVARYYCQAWNKPRLESVVKPHLNTFLDWLNKNHATNFSLPCI